MSRNADLRGQLEHYEPRDARGAVLPRAHAGPARSPGGFRPPRGAVTSGDDPFSRGHFQPGHFTASAFVLSPDSQALLLIFHGKLHRWLQPGGHVDATDHDILALRGARSGRGGFGGSSPGVPSLFDLDVHDIPPLKGDPAHAHFDVRFLFRARDPTFEAGSDAKAARWVPLEQINEEISDRSVMRAVEKLRALAPR